MIYDLSKFVTWDFCDQMVESILDSFGGLKDICFLLSGLFALLYFANILMKTWAKGEAFDFHSLFKPFVIGLVILNFNLLPDLIDAVVKPVADYTEAIAKERADKIETQVENYENKVKEYEQTKQRIADSKNLDVFDKMGQFFDNFGYYATETLMSALELILSIIYSALKISIRAFNISFRIILIVLGPISFAMSIIPYFKDNWKSWIAKYINVCLYMVVAAALDVIILKFREIMMDMQIEKYDEAIKQMNNTNDFFGLDAPFEAAVITSVFMLIFIAMYLVIPSIVNMILEKGETMGVQAGLGASVIGSGKIGSAMVMKGYSLSSSAASMTWSATKGSARAARRAGGKIASHFRNKGNEGSNGSDSKSTNEKKEQNNSNDNGAVTN